MARKHSPQHAPETEEEPEGKKEGHPKVVHDQTIPGGIYVVDGTRDGYGKLTGARVVNAEGEEIRRGDDIIAIDDDGNLGWQNSPLPEEPAVEALAEIGNLDDM